MKRCPCCEKLKLKAEFGATKYSPDGLRAYCKKCDAAKAKARRAEYAKKATPPPAETPWFEVPLDDLNSSPQAIPEQSSVVAPSSESKTEENPLEQAYAERAKKEEATKEKKQIKALLEENGHLRELLSLQRHLERSPLEIIAYKQPAHLRADAIACALASDWHIEEEVDGASVHGLNEYNLDVAKARAERYFKHLLRLADIQARDSKITTIFLGLLGDFFSGWIHEELVANTLLAPGDAATFCAGLLCSGIDFLLRESSYAIDIETVPGNHGRMTKQVHFGDPSGTSLESVMYRMVALRYEGNQRVRFGISGHAMVYRRFFEKFTLRLIHGYEVKYGGGVGGLTIPLNKAIAQWDKAVRADVTCLGHFHQQFDGGRFLTNGSLIGYNLFAQAIRAEFEEAKQLFFLIHARNGGQKSVVAPIWLDDAHHEAAAS